MKTVGNLQPLSFLENIIANGGPEVMEYEELNQIFDQLSGAYQCGEVSDHALQLLQNGFGDEGLKNTMHGHIKSKPYGYAGDFMIIDKIYSQHITTDRRFKKWDLFWNNHSAAKAVRNRKDYFIKTMTSQLKSNAELRLLNVASGPARDIAELYETLEPGKLNTVCIEADLKAINYAKKLTKKYAADITFIHQNIFRFNTNEQFNKVWSAGLFDYFDDRLFIKLLRKFIKWTKPGGEVIIGNFGNENPSRNYMELIGDWHLYHRSENTLIEVALKAGVERENISVGKEFEGVNLFLHVKV